MKKASSFILLVLLPSITIGQCWGNLILNGSITGAEGEFTSVPYWEIAELSPDVNDSIGPLITTGGYEWTGQPLSSHDGGTWANLFGNEKIGQVIEVERGIKYDLEFEYAAQGIEAVPVHLYNSPVGVDIYINENLVFTSIDDSTQFTWENASFSFIADSASLDLRIGSSKNQYVAVDGICLTPHTNTNVPESNNPRQIKIYPNPVVLNGTVQVSSWNFENYVLVTLDGKCIKTGDFNGQIKLDGIMPGIYFLKLTDGSETLMQRLLITNY